MNDAPPTEAKKKLLHPFIVLILLLVIISTVTILIGHKFTNTLEKTTPNSLAATSPMANSSAINIVSPIINANTAAQAGQLNEAIELLETVLPEAPSQTLREALFQDIEMLKEVHIKNTNQIIEQLESIKNSINSLTPVPGLMASPSPQSQKTQKPWWKSLLEYPFIKISDMIIIQRNDAMPQRLPTPEQLDIERQKLSLLAMIAQEAITKDNQILYEKTLEQLSTKLKDYFGSNQQAIQPLLNTVADLSSHRFNTVPQPLTSLMMINPTNAATSGKND